MKYKWFTAAFLSLCLIPAAGMLVLPEQKAAGNEHLTPKPSLGARRPAGTRSFSAT